MNQCFVNCPTCGNFLLNHYKEFKTLMKDEKAFLSGFDLVNYTPKELPSGKKGSAVSKYITKNKLKECCVIRLAGRTNFIDRASRILTFTSVGEEQTKKMKW